MIPIATTDNRAFTLDLAARRPDRFFTGFSVTNLETAELDEMRGLLGDGTCRFVKVHPRTTGILPLDADLDPFLAVAEETGTPVIFCTYMRGPRVPMKDLSPLIFDELARRRPGLRMVLAHAGSYRPLEALAVAQSHPNVYLELSHVLEYFLGCSLELDFRFILDKLDRKVVFGSDFPEYPIDDYLERAKALTRTLTDFDAQGFFSARAAELYGV